MDMIRAECLKYYFHIPAIGSFDRKLVSDHQYVSDDSLLSVIKVGFSIPGKREIIKNRLYIITGRCVKPRFSKQAYKDKENAFWKR